MEVANPEKLLAKFSKDQHVRPTPDMSYKFVAKAPENLPERPLVIGFGPCGLFAGLVLAQMGLTRSSLSAAKRCVSVPKIPSAFGVSVL